eukprot:snap_masked-scaffold_21-processed-gene-0.10-mRNA-1 protein AED:1.00 eAED:1.00 QI:0/-1/0/0/-1/1/1/0/66
MSSLRILFTYMLTLNSFFLNSKVKQDSKSPEENKIIQQENLKTKPRLQINKQELKEKTQGKLTYIF